MTEYDFSPEAYEAHNRRQRQIDRWRWELTRYEPSNPFKPIPGEHSEEEDDDYVCVEPPSAAEAVNGFGYRPQKQKKNSGKGKKDKKPSQQFQQPRPPLHAHNSPPYHSTVAAPAPTYPTAQYVPPLLQQQQVPATLTLPHGTATRSYSSPASHQAHATAHQLAIHQQQQQQYRYAPNNIYAAPLQQQTPPLPHNPYPGVIPPSHTRRHYSIQLGSGAAASQSTTALGSTTTTPVIYPNIPQQQQQQQHHITQQGTTTYYIPQALPGGGFIYLPQTHPLPQAGQQPIPQGVTSPPLQWQYYGAPKPKEHFPPHASQKSFFGALWNSGSKRDKDKERKLSRRESF